LRRTVLAIKAFFSNAFHLFNDAGGLALVGGNLQDALYLGNCNDGLLARLSDKVINQISSADWKKMEDEGKLERDDHGSDRIQVDPILKKIAAALFPLAVLQGRSDMLAKAGDEFCTAIEESPVFHVDGVVSRPGSYNHQELQEECSVYVGFVSKLFGEPFVGYSKQSMTMPLEYTQMMDKFVKIATPKDLHIEDFFAPEGTNLVDVLLGSLAHRKKIEQEGPDAVFDRQQMINTVYKSFDPEATPSITSSDITMWGHSDPIFLRVKQCASDNGQDPFVGPGSGPNLRLAEAILVSYGLIEPSSDFLTDVMICKKHSP
jgi:hypothetical protein